MSPGGGASAASQRAPGSESLPAARVDEMKALIKERPEPGIAYRDVPDPAPGPGQVVVRVGVCGISGSEVGRYRWTPAYHAGAAKDMTRLLPRIMGHEFSGTVAAVGAGVSATSRDDAVVVQPVVGCGACEFCDAGVSNHCSRRITIGVHADGGFAEYCLVPAANVHAIPAGVSPESAALLQPFAIAAYALETAEVRAGQRIGVWGVGQIGMSIIQQAVLMGAEVDFAVGRDAGRLEAALASGARVTVSASDTDVPRRLQELFGGRKLDAIFEVSGHTPAINSALTLLRKRGRVLLIGNLKEPFHGDLLQAIMDQISILTVRTYSASAWRRALALMPRVAGQRSVLRLETVALADGARAFERAAAAGGVKFLLRP